VDSLRAQAAEITGADLTARLPAMPTGDEVERLANTLNEMLERLQSSADSQQRFVADASHELRSPVATIKTLHEVADAGGRSADWPGVSAEVLVEVGRLELLIADLLLLARSSNRPSGVLGPVDLSAITRGECARARRVPIQAQVPTGVLVLGTGDALARSLRNLLDNAERHATSTIRVTLEVAGHRAVLAVIDDGRGISRGERERVFERFVRLDDARARDEGGAGLGLAISRHLIEQQGGTIRAEGPRAPFTSGVSFVIEMPIWEEAPSGLPRKGAVGVVRSAK
jgi:signal transduction histidine kinase